MTTPPRCKIAPSPPAFSNRSCTAIWRGRIHRSGIGPSRSMHGKLRDTRLIRISPSTFLCAGGRCRRTHLGAHRRGAPERFARSNRSWNTFPGRRSNKSRDRLSNAARARRHCTRRGLSRRYSGLGPAQLGWHSRALPSARSVLVPVAAAGSGDRRQHRRRLSALQ